GNHGRAVAWAARELGHKAVIYMPKGSSKKRLAAIQNEGAIAYMTNVNHDETVKMCDDLAKEKKMGNGSRYCLGGLRGNPAVDYARIRRHCKGNNRTIESRKRKTSHPYFFTNRSWLLCS